MSAVGWIGSWLLALCAFPQMLQCIKEKNCLGLSWTFLVMWSLGEVLTLLFILTKEGVRPLIANYSLNLLFLTVILYYKVRDGFKKDV